MTLVKEFIRDPVFSTGFTRLGSRKHIQNFFGGYFFTVIERTNFVEKEVKSEFRVWGGIGGRVFKLIKMLEVLRGFVDSSGPCDIIIMDRENTLTSFKVGNCTKIPLRASVEELCEPSCFSGCAESQDVFA